MRKNLLAAIGQAVQAFQEATEEVDSAAATHLGLNRTDLRCLSVLARTNMLGASELAEAVGLSRAATTTALDRLERAGHARRVDNPDDRRGVRVELTPMAQRHVAEIYGPLAAGGEALLSAFSLGDLAAVRRYLEEGRELQRIHAKRIKQLRAPIRRKQKRAK